MHPITALSQVPVLISKSELETDAGWVYIDMEPDSCAAAVAAGAAAAGGDTPTRSTLVMQDTDPLATAVPGIGIVAAAAKFAIEFNGCGNVKEVKKLVDSLKLPSAGVSRLLFEAGDAISLRLLGACLGHHAELWQEIAKTFPMHFAKEFGGISIVEAIRAYLWRFRLPGESAQIERILDGFASAYFEHNRPIQRTESLSQYGPGAGGYYLRQPMSGSAREVCCIHCGSTDSIRSCKGCTCIYFCRACRKLASKRGHAAVGEIGHGVACIKAREIAGLDSIPESDGERPAWERTSPFMSKDSVMVLAYSIIMLTTNLHSPKVKRKMTLFEFLAQNRGINDGHNFPGDFLAEVYREVLDSEIKVMSDN